MVDVNRGRSVGRFYSMGAFAIYSVRVWVWVWGGGGGFPRRRTRRSAAKMYEGGGKGTPPTLELYHIAFPKFVTKTTHPIRRYYIQTMYLRHLPKYVTERSGRPKGAGKDNTDKKGDGKCTPLTLDLYTAPFFSKFVTTTTHSLHQYYAQTMYLRNPHPAWVSENGGNDRKAKEKTSRARNYVRFPIIF